MYRPAFCNKFKKLRRRNNWQRSTTYTALYMRTKWTSIPRDDSNFHPKRPVNLFLPHASHSNAIPNGVCLLRRRPTSITIMSYAPRSFSLSLALILYLALGTRAHETNRIHISKKFALSTISVNFLGKYWGRASRPLFSFGKLGFRPLFSFGHERLSYELECHSPSLLDDLKIQNRRKWLCPIVTHCMFCVVSITRAYFLSHSEKISRSIE